MSLRRLNFVAKVGDVIDASPGIDGVFDYFVSL
jgi:hypothetical protein